MFSLTIKEDQIIWVALIISVLIHGLLLTFSGKTFIQHIHFSVQPSAQMVEVSIEKINEPADASQKFLPNSETADRSVKVLEKIDKVKGSAHSISGVRVKANPDYFQNSPPEYPELAKEMHQEGLVMLSVDVDKDGEAINVEVIQSSGFHLLDQAALKAVRHWKFQPGSIGNIPIESTVTVPIRFRLEK